MDRERKAEHVGQVQDKFKVARMAIVTEYKGLTVAQMAQLRSEIHKASGEYKVIKNTLVRRALKDTVYSSLDHLLKGPNGWVFAYEDPVTLSKALIKFSEQNEKLRIKGGLLEGEFMDQVRVNDLAKLPSRTELQAKLLSIMQISAASLLRLIQEPGGRMVRLLEALRKGKEESP